MTIEWCKNLITLSIFFLPLMYLLVDQARTIDRLEKTNQALREDFVNLSRKYVEED